MSAGRCHYHAEHEAVATVTWPDGDVIHVCQPAANAAKRWAPSAAVEAIR